MTSEVCPRENKKEDVYRNAELSMVSYLELESRAFSHSLASEKKGMLRHARFITPPLGTAYIEIVPQVQGQYEAVPTTTS